MDQNIRKIGMFVANPNQFPILASNLKKTLVFSISRSRINSQTFSSIMIETSRKRWPWRYNSRINFIRDIITRVIITRQGSVNWQQKDRWSFNQSKFLRPRLVSFPLCSLLYIYIYIYISRINDCRIVPNRMSSSKTCISLYFY